MLVNSKSSEFDFKPQERFQTKIARHDVRWGRFARNVLSGEQRGETNVFAGYTMSNYHFITAILKSQSSVSDLVSNLFKSGNNKAFTSNFVFETEMMRFRKNVI